MKRKGMHETGGFQAVPEQPPAGKKSRKGLIAGGIIGGILLLAAALLCMTGAGIIANVPLPPAALAFGAAYACANRTGQ